MEMRSLDAVLIAETGRGGTIAGFGSGDAFPPIFAGPHLAMVHRNLSRRTTAMVEDFFR